MKSIVLYSQYSSIDIDQIIFCGYVSSCIFELNMLFLHEILISERYEILTSAQYKKLTTTHRAKLVSKHDCGAVNSDT